MRIGLISDIHANATALRAVFNLLDDEKLDAIVCAGDIVGYGPSPAACVELIQKRADVCVAGNHDRNVETPENYARHPTAGPGLQHAANTLSDDQLRWLRKLPDQATVAEASVLVTHSHPDPTRQGTYVYPDGFGTIAKENDSKMVVLGHTHIQGCNDSDNTAVVNPGSVGQPRDCDPDAAYAIVDTEDWSIDLHRTPYDIGAVQNAVEEFGLPSQTWRRLRDGV